MIISLKNALSSRLFQFTLLLLIITDLAVLLNIPILRQFSGFIFLTFVPGFLILTALKLNKLCWVEKIVLSVGLSIAFTMLFGAILNYLSLLVGYTKPLSTFPILASFGIATVVLATFAYRRNKDTTFSLPHLGLTIREKLLLIIPLLLPIMSITGMRLMNTTNNNLLLMLMLFLIPAYVVFIAIYSSKVSEKLYPSMIFLIGLSLLIMLALRSNHLTGTDVHEEYSVFRTTLDQMYWKVTTPSLLNGLLSISLLPSIYQVFLKMNPETLFRLLFPLLFSISPLVVYVIAKRYVGSFYAFLTSFLFMSQFNFLFTTDVPRTNTAILFFALAIMVNFHAGLNEFSRRLFFLVFAISTVVSHYSTSYIFFLLLLLTWVGTQTLQWIHLHWKEWKPATQSITTGIELNDPLPSNELVSQIIVDPTHLADKGTSSVRRGISLTIILLFFVVIFLWQAQITNSAFDSAVGVLSRTFNSLNQSFLTEAKGPEIVGAFGQSNLPSVPQQVRFYWSWFTVIFILVGGVSIAVRYKSAVAYPDSESIKPGFLESKFELEYFIISAGCGLVLTIAVVLPLVSLVYSMERAYFQTLTVLATYFVICGMTIARWLRIRPYLIMLPVLIPYFLCVTGALYQLFNLPASVVLNSEGTEYEHLYLSDEKSYGIKWLAQKAGGETIYTDYGQGPRMLASQGGIAIPQVRGSLTADYRKDNNLTGYIYLFYPAVVKGEVPLTKYAHMNIVPLPEMLASRNELYTNGSVEIYR